MRGSRGESTESQVLPAVEDVTLPPDARRYEALGRVMAALSSQAEMLESCRDLAWRQGNEDTWHVEWSDGPYASEVAALLVECVRAPSFAGGLAGFDEHPGTAPPPASTASLDVMGVTFVLRAIDPLGREHLRDRLGTWRMSEALDSSRRSGSRRHWDELLGG